MAVKWNPLGNLDLNADPLDLPSQLQGNVESSGAMTRCTNLDLSYTGTAKTRAGCVRLLDPVMDTGQDWNAIFESAGDKITLTENTVWKNGVEIETDLTKSGQWYGAFYQPWASDYKNLFFTNGTDRKRLEETSVMEWGIDPPAAAPTVSYGFDYAVTQAWETSSEAVDVIVEDTTQNTWGYIYDWEALPFTNPAYPDDAIVFQLTYLEEEDTYSSRGYNGLAVYLWEVDQHNADPRLGTTTTFPGTDYSAWQFTMACGDDKTCCFDWEIQEVVGTIDYEPTKTTAWCFCFELDDWTSQGWFAIKMTYCRKRGDSLECESNPSPIVWQYAESGLYATWGAPSDTQVTHVRFYRSLGNQADLYYCNEFEVGDLAGVLSTWDDSLGALIEEDHDRPPSGGTAVAGPNYNGYMFMVNGSNVHWCKAQQPEYWPATNYVEVSEPGDDLVAPCYYGGSLYIASANKIWLLQGTGTNTYFPIPQGVQCGTLSHKVFAAIKGFGIMHLGHNGIYCYTTAQDKKLTDRYDPIFQGTTSGIVPGMDLDYRDRATLLPYDGRMWFWYPADGTDLNDCIVIDLNTNKGQHYQYTSNVGSICVDYNQRLIGVSSDGYLYSINDDDYTDDNGTAISWEVESKEFGNLRRHFPRAARWDVLLGDTSATASGKVVLDGTTVQTHQITVSRDIKRRLVAICNGTRLSLNISGTGTVSIHSAEVE